MALGIPAFVAWFFWRRPIVPLDEGATSRALNVISGLATIAALFQLARLCVFIVNPAAVGFAIGPSRRAWSHDQSLMPVRLLRGCSFSSNRAQCICLGTVCLPGRGSNRSAEAATHRLVQHRRLCSIPPPFLLLPRTLAILTPEFLRFRMVWFALNDAMLVIGLLVVARMLRRGARTLLLSPLVLASDIPIAPCRLATCRRSCLRLR